MFGKNRKGLKIKSWMIRNALMPLQAWGEIILLSCAIFALLSVMCIIFYNADALGNYFIPVLIGYLIVLTIIAVAIYHYREKRNLYATIGPELYYLLYPKEKRRKEKLQLLASRWKEQLCRKHSYKRKQTPDRKL